MSRDLTTYPDISAPEAPAETDPSQPAIAERSQIQRREVRNPTNWIAVIRFLDGTEIPCNVKDVSVSGAKLGVPESVVLPHTFMLKVVGRDFVCLVKLAWRRGNFAGVKIERVGRLPTADKSVPELQRSTEEVGYKSLRTTRSRISSF